MRRRLACRRSGRRRKVRLVVAGVTLGLLALFELAAQITGFLGAAAMSVGVGLAVGVGELLALEKLLLTLPATQVLHLRIVPTHEGKDRPRVR